MAQASSKTRVIAGAAGVIIFGTLVVHGAEEAVDAYNSYTAQEQILNDEQNALPRISFNDLVQTDGGVPLQQHEND
jgi:hypothetical protein